MRFFATPPVHGALARYINHPAGLCFPVPQNVSYEEAAMVEPLSVGVYACTKAELRPGQRVLVTGAGPIGLVTLLAARAFGASEIAITDLDEGRLALAAAVAPGVVTINAQDKGVRAYRATVYSEIMKSCLPPNLICPYPSKHSPLTSWRPWGEKLPTWCLTARASRPR